MILGLSFFSPSLFLSHLGGVKTWLTWHFQSTYQTLVVKNESTISDVAFLFVFPSPPSSRYLGSRSLIYTFFCPTLTVPGGRTCVILVFLSSFPLSLSLSLAVDSLLDGVQGERNALWPIAPSMNFHLLL